MHYFGSRTWNIVIRLQKLAGFWPHQNKFIKYALRSFLSFFLLLVTFGLARRLVKEWHGSLHIVIENLLILISCCAIIIIIVTVCMQGEKSREIIDQIASHRESIVDEEEVIILRNHTNEGLALGIKYSAIIGVAAAMFICLPIAQMYYLYFFGHGALEKKLPVYVDFFVDEQEYFFLVSAIVFLALVSGIIVYLAFGLTVGVTIKHTCALFEITKYRLKTASGLLDQCYGHNNKRSKLNEAEAYQIISTAVDLHNKAFQLTELIDEAYKGFWFIIVFMNAIAIAPLPVSVMLYLHNPFELFRRSFSFFIFPVSFYAIFLQGQLIIDYSSSVFDSCYEFCSYKTSKRFRTAISIIMIRSLQPCQLTGGNMFVLCMETYCVMLKTAVSYISMFRALDL